jgi:hypothetical protein
MSKPLLALFIACQFYVVLFIAIHDWIPLGRLNNLSAVRAADTTFRLLLVTAVSTLPFAIGLAGCIYYASTRFPEWLMTLLWISYIAGAYGMLRAWWIPYLFVPDPVRAARYQARFAHTHAFLPARNGIRPDTLHVSFHAVFLLALGSLSVLTFGTRTS